MSSEKVCQACGSNNQPQAQFCVDCGSNLNISTFKNLNFRDQLPVDAVPRVEAIMKSLDTLEGIDIELEKQQNFVYSLNNQLKEANDKAQNLFNQLGSETKDVEKLESFTFTSLFAKIKGDFEEKLAKETEEQALAQEKYNAALEDVDELELQLQKAHTEQTTLEELSTRQRTLRSELDQTLEEVFQGVSQPEEDRLENEKASIADKMRNQEVSLNQNLSAQGYISNAISLFQQAYDKLSSAGNYAAWDTFFDGGIIADSMKHSRWDDARNLMRRANQQVQFARSIYSNLPDIFIDASHKGSDFFDVWMDNIFSDFRARDQIRQSRDQVRWAINRLQEVRQSLVQSGQNTQNYVTDLRKQYTTTHKLLREKRLELLSSVKEKNKLK